MKRRIMGRLGSRRGESITETLVALLISSLALVMLAGAIGKAATIVKNSETQMTRYYEGLNQLGSPGDSGMSFSIKDRTGKEIYLAHKEGAPKNDLKYAVNASFPERPVIAYCMGGE